MTKVIVAAAALLAWAVPSSASAADQGKWLSQPACSATVTSLTCGGRAVISRPQSIPGVGGLTAAIVAQAHYTCTDPIVDLFFPALGPFQYVASADFRNGHRFSVQFTPTQQPGSITAMAACNAEWLLNDPSYYNVSVVIGWGLGSATPITALDAPIGTVSPG